MSLISPLSDVDFRSILLPPLSFLFGNGVIIRLCFSLSVQQNSMVHWHFVLFITVLSSSSSCLCRICVFWFLPFPVFLLPSSFSCGLIFPPHLSSVWLISSALLPESLPGLLSLITCTASPSLGFLLFKPVLVCLCVSFIKAHSSCCIGFFPCLHLGYFSDLSARVTVHPEQNSSRWDIWDQKSGPSKEPQRYSSLKKTTPVNVYFITVVLGNWTPYRITAHKILKDDIFGFL